MGPRVFTCPGNPEGYLTWCSRAGSTCFYVSKPPRRGIYHWPLGAFLGPGTERRDFICIRHRFVDFLVSRRLWRSWPPLPGGVSNMVVPSWNHVFSRVQTTQGWYLTWWSRAGTMCLYVSRPPRGVSNMVVQLRFPRLAEQRQSPLPLLALLARADPSAVTDDAGLQLRLPHLAEQRQSPLPFLALRVCRDL